MACHPAEVGAVPKVTYNLSPGGKAMFNGNSNVACAAVSLFVIVVNVISSNKVLLAAVAVVKPLFIQTLATVALELVPNDLKRIL